VVLIDDRDDWVWHRTVAVAGRRPAGVATAAQLRRPRPGARVGPSSGAAVAPDAVPEGARKFGYAESGEYVDLVETSATIRNRNAEPEIACFTRLSPYAQSKYPACRARQWVFVAQVDRKTALAPLDEMRAKIVRVGAVVGVVLSFIAVGLWAGLVVVLRRLEFASHG